MLVQCTVNNNICWNKKMRVFTHTLPLGLFSSLCEEMKENLFVKGAGSSQTAVGPAEWHAEKGKLKTTALSSLPRPASPEGKRNICLCH